MSDHDSSPREPAATRRLRAFAFGGGAFDTIMQLGVVQALLVSRGKAPDHVVGISAGAVNAAALAEILQAGETLKDPSARMAMRARRLRSFLDAYCDFLPALLDSVLPDTFEVNAKRPLKPIELPIHFEEERKDRADATRNKAGLIHLFNDLLAVRMPVSAVTRIVRRLLAIKQASELRRPISLRDTILWNAISIWLTFGRYMVVVAELFFGFLYSALVGRNRTIRRWIGLRLNPLAPRWSPQWLRRLVVSVFGEENATAAGVIQKSEILGGVRNVLTTTLVVTLFVVIWLLPFRLVSPPQAVVDKLDAAVPMAQVDRADWPALGERLPALREAVIELPTPKVEQLFRNLGTLAEAAWDVLETGGLIGWNFLIRNRSVLGVPISILVGAIALEMLIGLETALGFLLLMVATVNLYCAHLYDQLLPCIVLVAVILLNRLLPLIRCRILQYYEIGDSILSSGALRAYLVRCFDPDYYGKAEMDDIIRAALEQERRANPGKGAAPATLGAYSDQARSSPIHVGVVAADVASGKLNVIDETTPVVDAILAATAVVPFFPAQDPGKNGVWMIDGMNVSNEPIQPLLDDLRSRHRRCSAAYDDVKTVDIYPVSDVPVDRSELPSPGEYSTLVDVGLRALELKQFRDATMERRLTRLYTKALPTDRAFHPTNVGGESRTFIHAGIFPIELETPTRINRRLAAGSSADEFRQMLREGVADGCRSALEAMLPRVTTTHARHAITLWMQQAVSDRLLSKSDEQSILNWPEFPENVIAAEADAHRNVNGTLELEVEGKSSRVELNLDARQGMELRRAIAPRCMDVIRDHVGADATLPGSDEEMGPGLSEICRQCSLNRPDAGGRGSRVEDETGNASLADGDAPRLDQRLRVRPGRSTWPQWPKEGEADDIAGSFKRPSSGSDDPHCEWPAGDWPPDPEKPVVSFLFGGGVFRGVFHMGVMNALNEAGIEPNLVAGSSVGAIVAAMIAAVFKDSGASRQRRILDLTATFLAIDQLVLTDRLADFVRSFTLRAAEAEFSPHDLDRVLRRFDTDGAAMFSRRLRRVAAGLERLFYFSPFELYRVVEATRLRQTSRVMSELRDDLQELLERGGLAQEILGAEPLSLLIRQHVIARLPAGGQSDEPLFESFLKPPTRIFFLATATNLSAGALEILGAPGNERKHISLENGLLASSAFPAVFRPRQSWEIFRDSERDEKYIDGGTIDNLPLDAVARFLDTAPESRVRRRPEAAPHLIFTASLEVDRDVPDSGVDGHTAKDCLELMRRAGTFKYNRKIDTYAKVQRRLRNIHEALVPRPQWEPLNLHVIVVKPNWMCNTFGFHPMLGFRRAKQAESIAHGCASTLATLYLASRREPQWLKAWGAGNLSIDPRSVVESVGRKAVLNPQKRANGACWFRIDRRCPYSRQALNALNATGDGGSPLTPREIDELEAVYRACGRKATHEKKG